MSGKALKACAEYARLSSEIRSLTKAIGEALGHCEEGDQHLKVAFTPDIDDGTLYERERRTYMSDSEIRDYLAEQKCSHCLAAYEAILARKAVRKRFGVCKRAISAIGRAENARGIAS